MTKPRAVTRADLSEAVYHEVGLTRKLSAELVEEIFTEVSNTIVEGETVKLSGFGNFAVRQKRERIGRNPKTGKEVPITSRKVILFRASHLLKDKVNGDI